MLLVIDCGNTNVVFAVRDGTTWRGIWRVRTDAQRTSDEYGVWLISLLDHTGLRRDDISAAVIGTVVPAALYNLRRLCRDWFNIEPLVARSTLDWGFDIRVVNPAEVGADRLLNTLAAHQRFGGPLIIVDFGTATTFDVVDKDGAYLGGVICPGINLSLEALHQAAAQLPRIGLPADYCLRPGDADARKLGGGLVQRFQREIDAGTDDATEIGAVLVHHIERRGSAEIHDDQRAAEALVSGERVEQPIRADL